ncbi:MAG: cytochrome P450, partial [Anaerolineae bacterium]|nr:cytochrome P450 [Anaerolineae bacterium]
MVAAKAVFNLPGPPPARIMGWRGNMLRFFRDPNTYLTDAHQQYGNVVAFTRGGNGNLLATIENCPGTVFAFGPECNKAILSQPGLFQSSPMATTQLNHAPTTRLLSGIFSMNGDKHRQQRRLMMPAFHKKRIEAYRDDMVALCEQTLAQWQIGGQTDIYGDMMHLTLQIACKTLFGVDVQQNSHNIGNQIQSWIKMNLNPAIMLKVNLPGSPYRKFTAASERLNNDMFRMMQRKRETGVDEGDVFSLLIQMRDENGEQMTEDELIGQANILFFAGHETTANTLTWTLFLLTQHPDIYANVVEELDTVLHGDVPTVDQMAQLPLLDRVIKESMRILPPVPFLLRVAMEDTELEGQPIPQGSE